MVNKYIVNGLWREPKREIESIFKGSVGHVGGKKDGTGNRLEWSYNLKKESLPAVRFIVQMIAIAPSSHSDYIMLHI